MLRGEPPRPGIYLATGPSLLPAWFLRALGPGLGRGAGIFWIDGASPFDAYGSSYAARARGLDPKALLERVLLARAFNLWQLETMVCRKVPGRWRGEPVVVADPLPLFYDEDVSFQDVRAAWGRVIAGMKALPAVWMVLAVERAEPKGREALLNEIRREASAVARLSESEGRWLLEGPGR